MLDISINELHKKQIDNKNTELENFGKILKQCCEHIKITANSSDATSCFFQLPTFVFGIPLYDFDKCARFIIHNLKNEGFMIMFIKPNTLYISWDIRFTSKKNMNILPPPPPPPINMMQQRQLQMPTQMNYNKHIEYNNSPSYVEHQPQYKNEYNKVDDYKPSGNFLGTKYT